MQLFGWTLHSCWMLLTVISVCCCVDIGSSSEINEEVMEEQPWIWNEFKLAGAARKFHSILDNGGSDDEDNDNNAVAISDRAAAASGPSRASIPSAARPSSAIFATASNFRDNQQQQEEEEDESQQQKQQEQQQQRAGAMTADSPNVLDDYVYEDRPLMTKYALMADGEPAQYYGKLTSNLKRSQQPAPFNPPVTGKRRQKQQRNSMTLSSKSSTGGADAESSVASQQQQQSSLSSSSSLAAANIGRDSEPRVLPLLGFHSAVNKINRQKESLLKKILRQAARRQSMKRSPNCMRKCIAQGLLHPAQCHSLC